MLTIASVSVWVEDDGPSPSMTGSEMQTGTRKLSLITSVAALRDLIN